MSRWIVGIGIGVYCLALAILGMIHGDHGGLWFAIVLAICGLCSLFVGVVEFLHWRGQRRKTHE